MKVPPHKIEAVVKLIEAGSDVVIRSEVKQQNASSSHKSERQ
jgi:hypothetical protein